MMSARPSRAISFADRRRQRRLGHGSPYHRARRAVRQRRGIGPSPSRRSALRAVATVGGLDGRLRGIPARATDPYPLSIGGRTATAVRITSPSSRTHGSRRRFRSASGTSIRGSRHRARAGRRPRRPWEVDGRAPRRTGRLRRPRRSSCGLRSGPSARLPPRSAWSPRPRTDSRRWCRRRGAGIAYRRAPVYVPTRAARAWRPRRS